MAYQFADAENYRYTDGGFFLGVDDQGHETGITTERHLLTVAGSRSGKGAALAIPNLLRWPHNALVVDPKGENAAATWQAREAMGQRVYVLDPFKVANVPDRLRVSCNLLAAIHLESLTAREDIRVIADGMVMRYKAEDGTWDNGAVTVLSGIIAYVCADPVPEGRNLPAVRQLLTLPPETLKAVFAEMAKTDAFAGLCKAAASIGLSDSRKNKEFVGGAVDHSEWLDSPAMAAMLSANNFDLSELKTGKATVYLVLPPKYIVDHARFLRLFVRAALDAMARELHGNKCLFLLDEFFALGHIDQIAKAAGLMPGYGVQLWPILQDLGQLATLYGDAGAETFFGNSDAHIFFGNTDVRTLNFISAALGKLTPDEAAPDVPQKPSLWWPSPDETRKAEIRYTNEMNAYQHKRGRAGSPRLDPAEVRELIAKKDGDLVARSMIVFAKGGDVLNLRLAPYFEPPKPSVPDVPPNQLTRSRVSVPTPSTNICVIGTLLFLAIGLFLGTGQAAIFAGSAAGGAALMGIIRWRQENGRPDARAVLTETSLSHFLALTFGIVVGASLMWRSSMTNPPPFDFSWLFIWSAMVTGVVFTLRERLRGAG